MATGRAVFRTTLTLGALSVASKLLGFVREQAIAWRFGASGLVDSYVAAMFVPQLLSGIIGVIVTPFLPVYIEHRENRRGRQVAATTFSAILGASVVASVVALVFAPSIVQALFGDFATEQQILTAVLVRIIAFCTMFGSAAAFLTMLFNGNQDFLVPALSVFAFSIVVVTAVVTISGISIQGLAWATAAGLLAPVLIMLAVAVRRGYPIFRRPQFRTPEFMRVVKLSTPLWVSSLIGQVYMIVDRRLASGLDVGSLASLNFGNRLVQLPVGIIVTALVTALFPTMAEHSAKGDSKALAGVAAASVRAVCLLMVPASVGLIVLRYPIIRLAFERGAFDSKATADTAVALAYYAVGLTGLSVGQILSRVFHAMQDTVTPVKIGVATVVLNTALAFALVGPLGHGGLALTTSLGSTFSTVMLILLLSKRLERGTFSLGPLFAKVGLASALMGVTSYATLRLTLGLGQIVSLGTAVGGGLGVYGVTLLILRVEEASWAFSAARRRLGV